MSKTVIDIDIAKPADEVFAYINNFENNPTWQNGMVSCEYTSSQREGVGTTYKQVAQFMGRTIETNFEVIEFVPNRLVRFVSRESTFPLRIMRSVEPTDDGAHVHAIIEGESNGLLKLLGPLLDRLVNRAIYRDYAKLKQMLESDL